MLKEQERRLRCVECVASAGAEGWRAYRADDPRDQAVAACGDECEQAAHAGVTVARSCRVGFGGGEVGSFECSIECSASGLSFEAGAVAAGEDKRVRVVRFSTMEGQATVVAETREDLLMRVVEADNVTRPARETFMVIRALGISGVMVQHPGLPEGFQARNYADIEDLVDGGLLRPRYGQHGMSGFDITDEGTR